MIVMTNGSLVEILNTHDNIYNITKIYHIIISKIRTRRLYSNDAHPDICQSRHFTHIKKIRDRIISLSGEFGLTILA